MKVIIIGSELAGPALVLALHQQNISCKIFDLRDKAAFDGGFVTLAPNTLRALDRIGVYDRLSKQGWNYEQLQFAESQSRRDSPKRHSAEVRIQGLADFQRPRAANTPANPAMSVVDIKQNDHSTVVTTISDGRVEEADFLIGADGIHFRVRTHLEPKAIPTFPGRLGVGGSLARSQLPRRARTYICHAWSQAN